jgi:cysteine desulfurase / selenocysteine lyase
MQPGDEIVLSIMEHHANIVPWHFLRERQGVVLKWVESTPNGDLDPQAVLDAIGPRTAGRRHPHVERAGHRGRRGRDLPQARAKRACRCWSTAARPPCTCRSTCRRSAATSTRSPGTSFTAPRVGRDLHPRRPEAEMRPFLGGGDMIREVTRDTVTWNDPPMKFEAGTPGIVQQIGLGVALDYMMGLGMDNIAAHEAGLRDYARDRLAGLNWLNGAGQFGDKGAIFSFTLQGAAHAHDISTVLDKRGHRGAGRHPLRHAADGAPGRHRPPAAPRSGFTTPTGSSPMASGEKTLIELAEDFDVHPNRIKQWRDQLSEGATGVFGDSLKGRRSR